MTLHVKKEPSPVTSSQSPAGLLSPCLQGDRPNEVRPRGVLGPDRCLHIAPVSAPDLKQRLGYLSQGSNLDGFHEFGEQILVSDRGHL
jgi:hypothetical protein